LHLTIDGYGGDPSCLANDQLVYELLDRLPGDIGMTKISQPHVRRYVGEKLEDWGVSGFVLIAESHITVHTFPERGHVWVDVFSCKGFEAAHVLKDIQRQFQLSSLDWKQLERGLEYPHKVAEAVPVADLERELVASGSR
jgi:S-adenosylmethionine decarboxylase